MSQDAASLILGEYRRSLDDRFRLSIPSELTASWGAEHSECVLVKERPGCLSLWKDEDWETHLESGVKVVQSRWMARRLNHQLGELQALGRLLSTRHRAVQLAGRGRLLIPEGFREFLGVEAGGEVLIVGAAVCVEIWELQAWLECLRAEIPQFGQLLQNLGG
jgi:MraZ protein